MGCGELSKVNNDAMTMLVLTNFELTSCIIFFRSIYILKSNTIGILFVRYFCIFHVKAKNIREY